MRSCGAESLSVTFSGAGEVKRIGCGDCLLILLSAFALGWWLMACAGLAWDVVRFSRP